MRPALACRAGWEPWPACCVTTTRLPPVLPLPPMLALRALAAAATCPAERLRGPGLLAHPPVCAGRWADNLHRGGGCGACGTGRAGGWQPPASSWWVVLGQHPMPGRRRKAPREAYHDASAAHALPARTAHRTKPPTLPLPLTLRCRVCTSGSARRPARPLR